MKRTLLCMAVLLSCFAGSANADTLTSLVTPKDAPSGICQPDTVHPDVCQMLMVDAQKYCASKGLRLPTIRELVEGVHPPGIIKEYKYPAEKIHDENGKLIFYNLPGNYSREHHHDTNVDTWSSSYSSKKHDLVYIYRNIDASTGLTAVGPKGKHAVRCY